MSKPSSNDILTAKSGARSRKSAWNIVLFALVPIFVGTIFWGLVQLVWLMASPPETVFDDLSNASQILYILPLLFPSIPLGMAAANVVVYCIPMARRVLDLEKSHAGRPGFLRSTINLLVFALALGAISIPLSLCGVSGIF